MDKQIDWLVQEDRKVPFTTTDIIDSETKEVLKSLATLNSYIFKYKDEVVDELGEENKGLDRDSHFGIMAQELQANPLLSSTVSMTEEGVLAVDAQEVALACLAAVAELSKAVLLLEEKMNG